MNVYWYTSDVAHICHEGAMCAGQRELQEHCVDVEPPQRPKQLLTNGKRKKRGKADEPVLLEGSWNSSCSCFYHQRSKGKTALFSHGY